MVISTMVNQNCDKMFMKHGEQTFPLILPLASQPWQRENVSVENSYGTVHHGYIKKMQLDVGNEPYLSKQ